MDPRKTQLTEALLQEILRKGNYLLISDRHHCVAGYLAVDITRSAQLQNALAGYDRLLYIMGWMTVHRVINVEGMPAIPLVQTMVADNVVDPPFPKAEFELLQQRAMRLAREHIALSKEGAADTQYQSDSAPAKRDESADAAPIEPDSPLADCQGRLDERQIKGTLQGAAKHLEKTPVRLLTFLPDDEQVEQFNLPPLSDLKTRCESAEGDRHELAEVLLGKVPGTNFWLTNSKRVLEIENDVPVESGHQVRFVYKQYTRNLNL